MTLSNRNTFLKLIIFVSLFLLLWIEVYSYDGPPIGLWKTFDDQMISGFLSAIDSFAQGFGGTRGTEEITYKGFIVRAISGVKVKSIAILSESSDQSLTDRLRRYTSEFEDRFAHEITQFIEIGENQLSGNSQLEIFTRQMLSL